jgi:predicted DCC family thiol-disulfide oxidoreductase YuxK
MNVKHPPPDRPLLVYDGDCHFCKRWIARWRRLTGDCVSYREFQEVAERFPEIPRDEFARAVQFVELDGRVSSGADAVFRLGDFMEGKFALLRCLRRLPGFLPVARCAYRIIASHRSFFSRFA